MEIFNVREYRGEHRVYRSMRFKFPEQEASFWAEECAGVVKYYKMGGDDRSRYNSGFNIYKTKESFLQAVKRFEKKTGATAVRIPDEK